MVSGARWAGQIIGFPRIKIQSGKIIEKVRAGSFYMNSLKVYREIYKNAQDNTVGDPYEGKLVVHDAFIQIPELNISKVVSDYAFSTANENDFVFCMFGVEPDAQGSFLFSKEQKEKLIGFDETALLITDTYEFCRRIMKAAQTKCLNINSQFVRYYDKSSDDAGRLVSLCSGGIKNIVFYKPKEYSYQQEYRFTISNQTGDDHLELNIGDISDISTVLATSDMLSLCMVKSTSRAP